MKERRKERAQGQKRLGIRKGRRIEPKGRRDEK
jgi:hypothetical protein